MMAVMVMMMREKSFLTKFDGIARIQMSSTVIRKSRIRRRFWMMRLDVAYLIGKEIMKIFN